MTTDNCIYKATCSKDTCTESCIRLLEMSSLLEQSNIPIARQYPPKLTASAIDTEAFTELASIKRDIFNFVSSGNNLLITSHNTGNGKTSWAIKLMLKYFDEVWAGNGFKCRGLFIHVPTLLAKIKDFNNVDIAYQQIKELIPMVDLVIWDDIGASSLSAYDYSQLLPLIDIRINERKSNIFTSNYLIDELKNLLGAKIFSRLNSISYNIVLKGGDRRSG